MSTTNLRESVDERLRVAADLSNVGLREFVDGAPARGVTPADTMDLTARILQALATSVRELADAIDELSEE